MHSAVLQHCLPVAHDFGCHCEKNSACGFHHKPPHDAGTAASLTLRAFVQSFHLLRQSVQLLHNTSRHLCQAREVLQFLCFLRCHAQRPGAGQRHLMMFKFSPSAGSGNPRSIRCNLDDPVWVWRPVAQSALPCPAAMFQDLEGDVVDVPSQWRRQRQRATVEAQTDDTYVDDAAAQTHETSTVEARFGGADAALICAHVACRQTQTEGATESKLDDTVFDVAGWRPEASVVAFLSRVEPLVSQQLEQNATSRAFDGKSSALQPQDCTLIPAAHDPRRRLDGAAGRDARRLGMPAHAAICV